MRVRRRSLTVHLAAMLLAASCGGQVTARDQWTVWLSTDAPTPHVVDRALVEVLDADGAPACEDCRRLIGLPVTASEWPISFGVVVPPSGTSPTLRVRLYQAARVGADGKPPAATTIDRIAKFPPPRGNTDVALALEAECVGVAADPRAGTSCSGESRELVPASELPLGRPTVQPGSWPRAQRRPCTDDVDADMVCVPGGLFVLGDQRAPAFGTLRTVPERFVEITPFAIDRTEISVKTMRELVSSRRLSRAPQEQLADHQDPLSQCTYVGTTSKENDELPITCVDHALAKEACALLGKRLPTEAEWEWVAGNLEEETTYPWGNEGDPCAYADVGLGIDGLSNYLGSPLCRSLPGRTTLDPGLPRQANPRDVTGLGVMRLGGGVGEWLADEAANYDAPCWHPEMPFLSNARCDDGKAFAIRGGSWGDAPGSVRVVARQSADATFRDPTIGFRCARSL